MGFKRVEFHFFSDFVNVFLWQAAENKVLFQGLADQPSVFGCLAPGQEFAGGGVEVDVHVHAQVLRVVPNSRLFEFFLLKTAELGTSVEENVFKLL